ncbi:hypothetical protein NQZ68_009162, partial [Dissostichus eleginoides]
MSIVLSKVNSSPPICQSAPLLRALTQRATFKEAALSMADRSNTLNHLTQASSAVPMEHKKQLRAFALLLMRQK